MSVIPRHAGILAAVLVAAHVALGPVALAQDAAAEEAAGASPWIAGPLSLIVPGLGQLYAGDPGRALLVFGGAAALVTGKLLVSAFLPPKEAGTPATQPRAPLEALDLVLNLALPTYWAWNVGDAVGAARPSPSPSPSPGTPPVMPPGTDPVLSPPHSPPGGPTP